MNISDALDDQLHNHMFAQIMQEQAAHAVLVSQQDMVQQLRNNFEQYKQRNKDEHRVVVEYSTRGVMLACVRAQHVRMVNTESIYRRIPMHHLVRLVELCLYDAASERKYLMPYIAVHL